MAYTAIDNPELYFQAKAYSGTGSSQAYTLDGDEDMSPNFVWIKNRGESNAYHMYDTVRGVEKRLRSNGNNAETDESGGLTAFGSDGFTVNTSGAVNGSGENYVTWCWKESATAGFDIISYTGDGSDRDLSHSLSASPEFIIIKQRSGSQDWSTQTTALGLANYVILNGNNASAGTSGALVDAVSSSTISVDDNGYVNASSNTYIGYLWRSVQGYSKFGKYTGNGNADGTFVYTGFRPAWVMVKITSGTDNWVIDDTKRATFNVMENTLFANANTAEYSGTAYGIDFLSNGFKIRNTDGQYNTSSGTYIYAAFAEASFVNSKGVPCNAR